MMTTPTDPIDADAQPTCAHAGCTCRADGAEAVVRCDQRYCSSACAAGEGCEHAGCACGVIGESVRRPRATAPEIAGERPPRTEPRG